MEKSHNDMEPLPQVEKMAAVRIGRTEDDRAVHAMESCEYVGALRCGSRESSCVCAVYRWPEVQEEELRKLERAWPEDDHERGAVETYEVSPEGKILDVIPSEVENAEVEKADARRRLEEEEENEVRA